MSNEGLFRYVIELDPLALARPRMGNGNVFDSQKKEKLYYGLYLARLHGDRPFYKGPIHLEVTFYMRIPKMSNRKMECLEDKWHITRPDISNCLKFIEDVGIGILYEDDSIICSELVMKRYSMKPRIEFSIVELT